MQTILIKLDELNVLISNGYFSSKSKDEWEEDLLDFLIDAYLLGIGDASQMMGVDITPDTDKMEQSVFKKIEGKTFADRVREKETVGELQRLTESEYHRVYSEAVYDGVQQHVSKTHRVVFKTWHTRMDDRVRDTHTYLEGLSLPLGSEFYTYDGDHALFPSGFQNAENNVNCRCWLTYSGSEPFQTQSQTRL